MATTRVEITTPVGRFVEGSLSKPNTTDFDGKPLTTKTGPNTGQARSEFFFALAIPKTGEAHWGNTPWGNKILTVGAAAFPQSYQRPDFAWKIVDGDSTIPNKRNTKPCDKEGYPGHWVVRFSGGYAPKIYRQENGAYVQIEAEQIKPGYFMQVACNVDGNGNQNNPGIYINHSMVCFSAYGEEINFGPNVNEAGFGQAPLPAGASAAPLASSVPLPAAGGVPVVPTPGAIGVPVVPLPGATAVVPNPQFLNPTVAGSVTLPPTGTVALPAMPAPVTAVPAVPLPSVVPAYHSRMTAKAGTATLEQFMAQGWTEANLVAHGYMTA